MALMLTDFSEGMLTEAKQKLVNVPGKFTFALADAESLPTGPNSVHAVIANHMLYHVPHLEVALTEIHRVLKPGGTLYCTTNGSKYMVEVGEILGQFDERIDYRHRFTLSFTLENGPELLSKYFEQVETRRYEDSLAVTNADDLIKCILSTGVASNAVELLKGNRIEEFRKLLEEGISAEGSIRISKPSGMLIARRAA
jgi:ubiquinone/menaquinone biosynthesis C-methylase UbiE